MYQKLEVMGYMYSKQIIQAIAPSYENRFWIKFVFNGMNFELNLITKC